MRRVGGWGGKVVISKYKIHFCKVVCFVARCKVAMNVQRQSKCSYFDSLLCYFLETRVREYFLTKYIS